MVRFSSGPDSWNCLLKINNTFTDKSLFWFDLQFMTSIHDLQITRPPIHDLQYIISNLWPPIYNLQFMTSIHDLYSWPPNHDLDPIPEAGQQRHVGAVEVVLLLPRLPLKLLLGEPFQMIIYRNIYIYIQS